MSTRLLGPVNLSTATAAWDRTEAIAQLVAEADHFHERNTGQSITPRLVDRDQPAGRRPYIGAAYTIAVALDHQRALRALVEEKISPHSPWSLLRVVYEAPIWVMWVLEPEASEDRRARALRREVLDHKESGKFEASISQSAQERTARSGKRAKAEQSYHRDCTALGLKWSDVGQKLNMVDEIKRLGGVKEVFGLNIGLAEGLWRMLSGHVHGYSYATRLTSTVESSQPIQGGVLATLTINEDLFTRVSQISARLLDLAIQLYHERSTQTVTSQ